MTSPGSSDVLRWSQTLFLSGTAASLTDETLLDRVLSAPPEAASAAFEALLKRHGSMVWRVCRDVLPDLHAAEDAFQAAFLVLLRKGGSIQSRDALGPWLYGVAYRVAMRTKQQSQRTRPVAMRAADVVADRGDCVQFSDEVALLHEEIGRLPEKYRMPIVLCYFEGRTNDDVAQQLGWPVGTVSGRLTRARALLRSRLIKRGAAPGLAVGLLDPGSAFGRASFPESLAQRTLALVDARSGGAIHVASSIASLAELAPSVWPAAKAKWAAAVVLAGLSITMGSGHDRQEGSDAGLLAQASAPAEKTPETRRQQPVAQEPKTDPFAEQSRPTLQQWAQDEIALLEARVKAKQAEVTTADAQIDLANATLAITHRLRQRGKAFIAEEEVLKNEAEVKVASALGESARAELREAEIRLDQAKRMVGQPEMMRTWLNRQGQTSNIAPLERRMDNLEKKLDQIIQLLSKPTEAPRR